MDNKDVINERIFELQNQNIDLIIQNEELKISLYLSRLATICFITVSIILVAKDWF